MGLFSFLFKKNKDTEYDEKLKRVFDEYDGDVSEAKNIYKVKDPGQDVIIDKCEKMMSYAHQVDVLKMQYDDVTSYLVDIEKIDAILPDDKVKIKNYAERIKNLNRDRKEYQEFQTKLSSEKYSVIRKNEDEFPMVINRLIENERYKSMIKRDMDILEGERTHYLLNISDAEREDSKLKRLSISLLILAIAIIIFLFVERKINYWDITLPLCIVFFIVALLATLILLRLQSNANKVKFASASINKIINLSNRLKIKYVTYENAVSYTYAKYNIHNSRDLTYLWDEYSKLKKEKEKHSLSTADLEYYGKKLITELARYDVNDPGIWIEQSQALLDDREMVEIRHKLNEKRQTIRSQIELNSQKAEELKDEIMAIVEQYPQYSGEVISMVKSIDSDI